MKLAAALAAAAIALAAPATASASTSSAATLALRGIARGLAKHWLKPQDAARYRTDVARAQRDAATLPKLRAYVVESQLAQLTTLWDSYISPRALALFSQVETNLSYLETHPLPATSIDITGDDGIVYRWFSGHGFEFHPLANFSALNNVAAANDAGTTGQLAAALLARAIPRDSRLIWEYAFAFGSGRPPWASGMAQAVAAQALARASALLEDPSLGAAAVRAYASVPPFLLSLPSGPWIRLYGFNNEVVLNAQLQTILSLLEYAQRSGDASASTLAQRLDATAQALLPRFDTGDWSRYELGGGYAPREYERYVTDLLAKLGRQTQEPFWTATAQRFHDYLYTPPQVTQPAPPPTIWPQPADGYLDAAPIQVTLSMRASISVAIAGQVTTYRVGPGPHLLTWRPPSGLTPGTYPVRISAVSFAGNRAAYSLAPVVVAWDTTPPPIAAALQGTTLTWQANDPGTPWLALAVDVADPNGVNPPQTLDLGRLPTSGQAQLALPPGTWTATLRATNSAGLTTTYALGTVAVSG
jgi:hypothetical protein